MFNFFKKKNNSSVSYTSKSDSFKIRVAQFWGAFINVEEQLRSDTPDMIDAQKRADIFESLLSTHFPKLNIMFEFAAKGSNELYLSPDGNWLMLMATTYIVKYAPKEVKERWKLYPTKSNKEGLSDFSLRLGNNDISVKDIIVYYDVNKERRKVDIQVYIKDAENLPQDAKFQILFIVLDNSISEIYTMLYIGDIDFIDKELSQEGVSMDAFKSKMDEILTNEDWTKNPDPDELFSSFELTPNDKPKASVREDIYLIVAKNAGVEVYKHYLGVEQKENKEYFSNFEASGIFFKTIFYDLNEIPRDQVLDIRDQILSDIESITISRGVAKWTSSATGINHSYIDFIVCDVDSFTETIKEIFNKYNLPIVGIADFNKSTEVIYFKK